MSELRVDSVKSKGGGAPNLPKGVTISGIATAVTLGATSIDGTNVNVSGVVTSGSLSGNLTGTPTLGLGVTINASGLHITGVATAGIVSATTLYGDGANVTGLAVSVSPWYYNPDTYDSSVTLDTGIGITFNQQILAGSGDITLRIAGAAGTVVENFGVGSSVTISENRVSFTPTSSLTGDDTVYYVSYPSGCFTNNIGESYVGTAYTFSTRTYTNELWSWGRNLWGGLGLNNRTYYSSPVQIPGTTWSQASTQQIENDQDGYGAIRTDGTLWMWGRDHYGQLGDNDRTDRSSPVQVGSDTTWSIIDRGLQSFATKTDGTLWSWGYNSFGQLGLNNRTNYSSPVQIPGSTWPTTDKKYLDMGNRNMFAIKTDGTLWVWGVNGDGDGGTNNQTNYSSPTQIPGTTWASISATQYHVLAVKTDGTLWAWGNNQDGKLGDGSTTLRSSPVQIPGTTWSTGFGKLGGTHAASFAIKTDGTLWSWGAGNSGQLAQNNTTHYSSPKQVPGTTWNTVRGSAEMAIASKTDGTLWCWGSNAGGALGLSQAIPVKYSSPIQIPGTDWDSRLGSAYESFIAFKKI